MTCRSAVNLLNYSGFSGRASRIVLLCRLLLAGLRAQTVQMADVTDACVVVTRWFGGVHLGPSRFAIINNTARQLLVQEGFMQSGATRGKGKK